MNTMTKIGPLRLAAVGAMGFGLIIFFIFVSTRLSSGQMKLLYSDLSAQDRNAIVRELEAAKVAYAVNDTTGEIQVGAKEVGRVRMMLAEKGLPDGGSVGYEIFDKESGLGATRFDQDMKQLRALEGELTRTVTTIKNVESARIHLVLPKRELFSREAIPASASVFLKLHPGRQITNEQVLAIQHLIAAAVPELNPKHVSVVDQAGNLLANGRDESGNGVTTANVEKLRLAYEQKMTGEVEEMIAKIVGLGKVRATVTADIDYDKVTTNDEELNPEGQVARSTQTVEEYEKVSEASKNNVSVENNLPGLPGGSGGDGNNQRSNIRTEEITNFEISKTIRSHTREGGQVRSLSVAVLLDGTYQKDKDGKLEYTPRTQQELDQIRALVSSAIGFDEKRGDKLEIVNMRFAEGEDIFAAQTSEDVFMGLEKEDMFRLAETGVLGLVSILVVLLVLRPMASKLLAPREGEGSMFATNADGTMMLDTEGRPMLANASASMPQIGTLMIEKNAQQAGDEDPEAMVDLAAVDGKIRASSIQKVNEIIDRYPNEAVSIVRSWMFQEG